MGDSNELRRLKEACENVLQAISSLEGRPVDDPKALRKAMTHAELSWKFLRSVAVDEEADLAGFLEKSLGESMSMTLGKLEEIHGAESNEDVRLDVVLGADVTGLSGDSETVPVLEFVSWLGSQRNVGVLHVQTEVERVSLYFDQGYIGFAETLSGPSHTTLGGILVELDVLTPVELNCLGEDASSSCLNLAVELLKKRFVDEEDLRRAVKLKIRRLFRRFGRSPSAKFRFQPGLPAGHSFFEKMELNALILDCARESDEERRQSLALD